MTVDHLSSAAAVVLALGGTAVAAVGGTGPSPEPHRTLLTLGFLASYVRAILVDKNVCNFNLFLYCRVLANT